MKAWWMEEHHDALRHWRAEGYRDMACVHVDAHLDVRDDGLVPGPGNSFLPWSGLHCGNYLTPALHEGLVRHLVWVIPDPLWEGDPLAWGCQQVQEWIDLTPAEYNSLRLEEGRLEGRLRGARLTLCRADQVPALGAPALLDVDVDYFLHEGRLWGTPAQLHERLAGPWEALTVALSVVGGYTPNEFRYLGEEVMQLFAGQTVSCAGEARPVDRGCQLFREGRPAEALVELEREDDPVIRDFLRATVYLRTGEPARAAKLLALDTRNPWLIYQHGVALRAAGRTDEAVTRLARAVSLLPRAEVFCEYVACLRELGREREAQRWVSAGLRLVGDRMSAAQLAGSARPAPAPPNP